MYIFVNLNLNITAMAKCKHLAKTTAINVLLMLITFNLFTSSLCLHTKKLMQYYSKSSNVFNNNLKLSSHENIRTKRDITIPYLASNERNYVLPDITNLLRILNVPGYSVHLLQFNDESYQKNYEKTTRKLPTYINPKSKSTNLKESKHASDRRFMKDSDMTNENNKTEINSGNTSNGCDINSNCNDQDLKDTGKFNEETTTDINEVTTVNNEAPNENLTIFNEYDDEEYGVLFDRANISPSLLASLVG